VGSCLQRQRDGFADAIELPIDLEISKPENSVSEVRQDFVSNLVTPAMFVESMLIAIDLDNEARVAALEIDDVICEWRLPAEVMADCAKLSKLDP
jgi:hypothetical protein